MFDILEIDRLTDKAQLPDHDLSPIDEGLMRNFPWLDKHENMPSTPRAVPQGVTILVNEESASASRLAELKLISSMLTGNSFMGVLVF